MKIKETTLKEVLNFPLSKIQDFDSNNYEHLKEKVNHHSNFIIYNYSFDNIGITNQSELKIQNESKNKIIDLLTILLTNRAQFYYDKSTDSYLFLHYKDDFNFDNGEEVLICELEMR